LIESIFSDLDLKQWTQTINQLQMTRQTNRPTILRHLIEA